MHLKLHTDSQKRSLYVNEYEHDHTNHIFYLFIYSYFSSELDKDFTHEFNIYNEEYN